MRMNCPHCKCIARLHSLHAEGLLFREHVYCCSNPYCGHNFIVRSEFGRTLTPSKIPNPNVNIPISARATKRQENKAKREAAAAAAELNGAEMVAP